MWLPVGPLQPLPRAQDAVPHVVTSARAALLRMLLSFLVEVQRDLGIDADAEIVVHHGALVEALQQSFLAESKHGLSFSQTPLCNDISKLQTGYCRI